jgi:non-lysosomal glucosylceramidase
MKGPSSYCGGLWIAALLAAARLAEESGDPVLARRWRDQANAAAQSLQSRLFNGEYFLVDTDGPLSTACFIEQLFGPFLARRYGLGDIVPDDMAASALKAVFRRNFLEAGGSEGTVSLSAIPAAAYEHLPHADDRSFQTSEIQPGFNFSFAAQLESWGLTAEAEQLRQALHHQLYERRNLVFQTPAAYDRGGVSCRAILNMRPLSVWWMLPPGYATAANLPADESRGRQADHGRGPSGTV